MCYCPCFECVLLTNKTFVVPGCQTLAVFVTLDIAICAFIPEVLSIYCASAADVSALKYVCSTILSHSLHHLVLAPVLFDKQEKKKKNFSHMAISRWLVLSAGQARLPLLLALIVLFSRQKMPAAICFSQRLLFAIG